MKTKIYTLVAVCCLSMAMFADEHNGHEYVDLGLPSGLLWATCNVGADTPDAYGNYYAWGEIETKDEYEYETYKLVEDGDFTKHTKYCSDPAYGTVDNKTVLDLEDDVANVIMGGSWRMPTKAECDELTKQCTWTWKDSVGENNVSGFEVKSKKNDNSIFLPAAGWITGSATRISLPNEYGCYWSSTREATYPTVAWYLMFASDGKGMGVDGRSQGQSVRGVLDKTTNTLPTINGAVSSTTRKVFENGTLYILRIDGKYTIDGRKVE